MPNRFGRFDDGELVAGRFRILESITEGGMGAVYRAIDGADQRRVALKQCLPELDAADRRRFAREVRAMERITHPHVMPVLHAELDGVHPFFVMPEARCRLDERFDALRVDVEAALAAFEQICDGVIAIHDAGEIHRDLKPLNILLVDDRWVVSDLGLVVFAERDSTVLTRTTALVGTEGYIAPELRGRGRKEPDVRSDVFALGMVLYELITGSDAAYIDDALLPSALRPIVTRAVEPNPGRRTSSVRQLRGDLAAYRSTLHPGFDPLGRAKELAARRTPMAPEDIDALVRAYVHIEDDEGALAVFDELPDAQLASLARYEPPTALRELLRRYEAGLRAVVGRRGFAYAETVASRMDLVRRAAKHRDVSVAALRCHVIAAVDLWRFNAIDSLDEALEVLTDPRLAEDVAAMLLEERERTGRVLLRREYAGFPEAIRRVRAILKAEADANLGAG